ncbi:MAG: hypothetical protein OXC91_04105 [Rhodobacteraceae bacterium]|nr:hypothetical protein [Paracoccaceae bacterium]
MATGLGMFVPAILASRDDLHAMARMFFYIGILTLILTVFIAIATRHQTRHQSSLGHLFSLVCAFLLLPAVQAAPAARLLPDLSLLDAYLDFIACFTTTGIALHADPATYAVPLQFWRAEVAWLGGLLVWIAALAMLSPFNTTRTAPTAPKVKTSDSGPLRKALQVAVPIYTGTTAILWLFLIILGNAPLAAAMLAMATLATSGITLPGTTPAPFSEAGMLLFLALAYSRVWLTARRRALSPQHLVRDPELKLTVLLLAVALAAILSHDWQTLVKGYNTGQLTPLLDTVWGILFTTASHLATAGMTSAHWPDTTGLGLNELVLILLTIIGGGAATTAGGIKLLRVTLLYQSCHAEVDRMLYPSLVVPSTMQADSTLPVRIREAWLFILLFLFAVAMLQLIMTALGVDFTTAFVLVVSALSTNGPLVETVLGINDLLSTLSPAVKITYAAGMITGRIELILIVYLIGQFFR